jgi:hypothetical protein
MANSFLILKVKFMNRFMLQVLVASFSMASLSAIAVAAEDQKIANQTTPNDSSSALNDEVSLKNGSETDSLTAEDKELIARKGKILFKHLYEQEQLSDLKDLLQDENRDKKIKAMKENEYPLKPQEILKLREMASSIDKANNSPLAGPVDFKIKTIDIDVDAPKPIQIMVARGYSSSIMFFDQSGAPWPIEGDIIGDALSFASTPVEGKSHVGVFEIKRSFSESNALVNLKGLNVPVVIRLTGSEKEVDARISVRIPKFGPGAQLSPYVHREIENASPDMLSVLNGDKLNEGKLFELNGVPGTVWYKNNMLYVRTLANLISPPWKSYMTSPTGYQVYELPPVTNLLFVVDGEMKDATISKGFEVKLKQERSIFEDSDKSNLTN